jgi:hypothetical protein
VQAKGRRLFSTYFGLSMKPLVEEKQGLVHHLVCHYKRELIISFHYDILTCCEDSVGEVRPYFIESATV